MDPTRYIPEEYIMRPKKYEWEDDTHTKSSEGEIRKERDSKPEKKGHEQEADVEPKDSQSGMEEVDEGQGALPELDGSQYILSELYGG